MAPHHRKNKVVWKHFQQLERKPRTNYFFARCKYCDEDGCSILEGRIRTLQNHLKVCEAFKTAREFMDDEEKMASEAATESARPPVSFPKKEKIQENGGVVVHQNDTDQIFEVGSPFAISLPLQQQKKYRATVDIPNGVRLVLSNSCVSWGDIEVCPPNDKDFRAQVMFRVGRNNADDPWICIFDYKGQHHSSGPIGMESTGPRKLEFEAFGGNMHNHRHRGYASIFGSVLKVK